MDTVSIHKRDVVFTNFFGISIGIVCFLLILARGFFVKNYAGEVLILEFVSIFLFFVVFGLFFSQFLLTRLLEILCFSLGIFFCCTFEVLQNILLNFVKVDTASGINEILALSHIIEMILFTTCCCLAVILRMRSPQKLDSNAVVIQVGLGALLISTVTSVSLFFYISPLIHNPAQEFIFMRISLFLYIVSQFVLIATLILHGVTIIIRKQGGLGWNSCALVFIFLSNWHAYQVISLGDKLADGLLFKTGAFIIFLLGAINEYRLMFRERIEYTQTLERAITEQAKEVLQRREI